MILLIDNYDSFVHNLARYLRRLGQTTEIVRNDRIDAAGVRRLAPQAIVLSPGPCTPEEAGCSLSLVRELQAELPMLGICLGHQTVAAALGARIVRSQTPMHGRTSLVRHEETPLFAGIPTPFSTCRYHSLIVERESLPDDLTATAYTEDGTLMAIEHRDYPVYGVQFHPEAVLTEFGFRLLSNFLSLAGLPCEVDVEQLARSENRQKSVAPVIAPSSPVTF